MRKSERASAWEAERGRPARAWVAGRTREVKRLIALDSRELVRGWGGCCFGSTNLRCWIRIVSMFWKSRAKAWSELERRVDIWEGKEDRKELMFCVS